MVMTGFRVRCFVEKVQNLGEFSEFAEHSGYFDFAQAN